MTPKQIDRLFAILANVVGDALPERKDLGEALTKLHRDVVASRNRAIKNPVDDLKNNAASTD